MESIRHMLGMLHRKPSPELVESRIKTDEMETRVELTRKLLDRPESVTRFDLARLIDDAAHGHRHDQ